MEQGSVVFFPGDVQDLKAEQEKQRDSRLDMVFSGGLSRSAKSTSLVMFRSLMVGGA